MIVDFIGSTSMITRFFLGEKATERPKRRLDPSEHCSAQVLWEAVLWMGIIRLDRSSSKVHSEKNKGPPDDGIYKNFGRLFGWEVDIFCKNCEQKRKKKWHWHCAVGNVGMRWPSQYCFSAISKAGCDLCSCWSLSSSIILIILYHFISLHGSRYTVTTGSINFAGIWSKQILPNSKNTLVVYLYILILWFQIIPTQTKLYK